MDQFFTSGTSFMTFGLSPSRNCECRHMRVYCHPQTFVGFAYKAAVSIVN